MQFKIIRNFSFLTFSKILGDLFFFLFFIILSRVFGQEGLGQYSFAIAFTGFFVIFSNFGLYNLSIKDISRQKENYGEYFGGIFLIRLILSFIVFFVMLLILTFLSFSTELKFIIGLIGVYQISYAIFDGLCAVFIAFEDMFFAGFLDFILRTSISLIGIYLSLIDYKLHSVILVFPVMTILISFLTYKILTNKYGKIQFSISFAFIKKKIQEAFTYMLSTLLRQISTRIDVVLIGFLLGSATAGIYNAAYRIIFLFMFIPNFASIAIFPIISQYYAKHQKKDLTKLCQELLNWITIIGLPTAFGLSLIAPELIELIFGNNFNESATLLRFLAWVLFFSSFKIILSIFLTACDRQKERTICQCYASLVCVLGNVILIKGYGAIGAATAVLFSEIFLTFLLLIRIKKFLGVLNIIHRFTISSIASVSFFIILIYFLKLPMFFDIITAIVIYTLILISFKTIRKNEFQIILILAKSTLGTAMK